MTNDESNQYSSFYRAGQATAKGFADGIVLPDTFRDFEVRFLDYTIMRQMYIASPLITHKDVAFLREQLDVLTPEFRAFVLETARLICEAGEVVNPLVDQSFTITTEDQPGRYEFHNGEWRFTPEDEAE